MLLHPRLAAEFGADDHGFEMMAVAGHFDVVAGELFLDVGLDLFGGDHAFDGYCASVTQLVAALEQRQGGE